MQQHSIGFRPITLSGGAQGSASRRRESGSMLVRGAVSPFFITGSKRANTTDERCFLAMFEETGETCW
jgi:hypothetical protein